MREQPTFAELARNAKKVTEREQPAADMNALIPWGQLTALIAPHYPQASGRDGPPMPLRRMLRVYFLQHRFNRSRSSMQRSFMRCARRKMRARAHRR